MASKTVCILGATGKTGKWALKGALARGWNVKLLCRSPGKIEGLLKELFPDTSAEGIKTMLEKNVTSIQSSNFGKEELQKAFVDCDTVLSFVGMVKKGEDVVHSASRAVVAVMQDMADGPKTYIFQSAIGTNPPESQRHGQKALGCMVMCAIGCVPALVASFKDMSLAEEYIFEARTKNPQLNLIPLRCAILEDKKGLVVDYKSDARGYALIKGDETGPFAGGVDRQYVAQAALDLAANSEEYKNCDLSCCNAKKGAFGTKSPQSTQQPIPELEIEFVTEAVETVNVGFKKKPLGFTFSNKSPQGKAATSPIFVSAVRAASHAEELGVKSGWQVSKINGQSAEGMDFHKVDALFQEAMQGRVTKDIPGEMAKVQTNQTQASYNEDFEI